ncbi:MAG: HNH endonuclease [Methylovulum sp.]|nr:HNH endonuclease [Methylovulum sp.]
MIEYDDAFLQKTLQTTFESPEHYKIPKGIIRYDYADSHGWWVRVTRDKAMFRTIFFDSLHGGIENGLKKAILYRHELLSSFPITIKRIHARVIAREPENRIRLTTGKGKLQPYVAWEATWYDENHKVKAKRFSVNKFGHEEAKALALEAARANHNKEPKITSQPDPYQDDKFKAILRADVEVLASIKSARYSKGISKQQQIENSYPFALEGERKLGIHFLIERDRKLRNQKIEIFLDNHGKLFCELCNFRFIDAYPFLLTDIIEVHHIVPLSTLNTTANVSLSDLMLLCSNCHTAVHQGDAEKNLSAAMMHFKAKSFTD